MAQNANHIETKEAAERSQVKDYSKSPFVVKKTEKARETLKKFPVPEKYY